MWWTIWEGSLWTNAQIAGMALSAQLMETFLWFWQ
jgi:hypothetical protein